MPAPHPAPRTLSVGIDLVAVRDVADSLARHGERYERRLFRDGEIAYCRSSPLHAPERYAARFAAKEAAVKALRLGDEAGLDWRDIEVCRDPGGACDLALHGRVREHAEARGYYELAVSLSHDAGLATAVVTALARP